MTRKHTCIRRYAYNALRVFLLCVAVSTLSCSSTSSSLVYENPGLKYTKLRKIGHAGRLSKYHERIRKELPWIEFVNCHKMYFKDVNDLNNAVEAIARKRGVTTFFGKEDIKKQIKLRYPMLDQKTRYRLSFNYYGLSAFIDEQSFHRRDFYQGMVKMRSLTDYMYYIINSRNQVLLKIQTSDSENIWESDEAFVDRFITVMKKVYNR